MAKIDLLSAAFVRSVKKPGDYLDGRGLYLQVNGPSSKSYNLKYPAENKPRRLRGSKRTHEMGLGSAFDVTLAEAREERDRLRKLIKQGIDPIEHRRAERAALAVDRAKSLTFKQAAERYIAANRSGWGNLVHAGQWQTTLETYVYPKIGALPIQEITTALVMRVLEPVWNEKPVTASRVRGRIESVIGAAKARGEYVGENPATWKGHLDKLLPAPRKVRKVENHAALPYAELPAFMLNLRGHEGIAAAAMEFLILSACRSGEVCGARWSEIDLKKSLWTIPANRMKAGREHLVPLSPAAIALLERMAKLRTGKFVFFGQSSGRPLSGMALLLLLRRMNVNVTSHGFRATFRTWAGDETNFQREVIEKALAHLVGDETERSYDRGDLFKKRGKLMDAWATFATSDPVHSADVLPFSARAEA
jgi:integrase